jgi:hypothetical protein
MAGRGVEIQVRTFQSEEEIRQQPGFLENALVAKGNYARLLGDYRLPERLSCCLQRAAGHRCSVKHNYGFVVKLKDETVSIIGNQCGNTTFGAESALAKDMKLYANEKARQEALRRLGEILAMREAAESSVAGMYSQLKDLTERSRKRLTEFGDYAAHRIRAMSRVESNRVTVTGVRLRPYVEDGQNKTERTTIEITAGTLLGLSIFRSELVTSLQETLRGIAAAYREAETLDGSATTTTLSRVASAVSQLESVLRNGQELLAAEGSFERCDWSCLPFLAKETGDRVRLARMALTQANLPSNKDRGKEYIHRLEMDLKSRHGVQKLEIS